MGKTARHALWHCLHLQHAECVCVVVCSLEMWSFQLLAVILMVDYADKSELGLVSIITWFTLTLGFVLQIIW